MTAVGFITFISVVSRFKVTWFTFKMGYNYLYIMYSLKIINLVRLINLV